MRFKLRACIHCNDTMDSFVYGMDSAMDSFVYGRISGSAGSVSSAFSFPHNSVTVGRILFKFGRCMQ